MQIITEVVKERPHLPAPPHEFGLAVAVPNVVQGDNAKAALADTRNALAQANRRLAADRSFYENVRRLFGNNVISK